MTDPTDPHTPNEQSAGQGHEYDFKVEPCFLSVSTCQRCGKLIPQSELRICRIREGDANPPWFHFECLFLIPDAHPIFTHQVMGIENLNPQQREQVINKIQTYSPNEPLHAGGHEGVVIEYAKTMESDCSYCGEPISAPSELRVGLLRWQKHSLIPEWHHLFCIFRRPDYRSLGIDSVRQFAGYKRLEPHSIDVLARLVEAQRRGLLQGKRRLPHSPRPPHRRLSHQL